MIEKVSDLKVGKIVKDLHGAGIKITKAKIALLKKFERENPGKNAVYKGKITGTFLNWEYWQTHEKPKPLPRGRPKSGKKKSNRFKQLTQDEVKELYAREFKIKGGVNNVNTNTIKYSKFSAKSLEKKKT